MTNTPKKWEEEERLFYGGEKAEEKKRFEANNERWQLDKSRIICKCSLDNGPSLSTILLFSQTSSGNKRKSRKLDLCPTSSSLLGDWKLWEHWHNWGGCFVVGRTGCKIQIMNVLPLERAMRITCLLLRWRNKILKISAACLRLPLSQKSLMQDAGREVDRFPARLLVEVRRETNVFKSGEFFFSGSHSSKLASDGEVWHTSGI